MSYRIVKCEDDRLYPQFQVKTGWGRIEWETIRIPFLYSDTNPTIDDCKRAIFEHKREKGCLRITEVIEEIE